MHPIIGLVAPSGGGKTTLILELLRRSPHRFGAVKTLTTRAIRNPDEDAVFYDFTSRDTIVDAQAKGDIIQISEYAGHLYANDRQTVNALLEEKFGLMAIVEMGVKNFRAAGYRVVVVRIVPERIDVGASSHARPDARPDNDTRKQADAERAKENLHADCTIVNSFALGGKEKAVEELLKFIETLY